MKRAKKAKKEVAEAEQLMQGRMAVAGGGQVPALATLPLHIGVAAAPAPADKLQEQLEAAQDGVYRANVFDDLCRKELVRSEKQHDLNMKMYYARLERRGGVKRVARSRHVPV